MDRYCKFAYEHYDSLDSPPDILAFGDGPQKHKEQLMISWARNVIVFYNNGEITIGEGLF